jgi:hypothetical protein
MSVSRRAPHAPGGLIIAVVLGLLLLALPATSHATPTTPVADPGTGWHGRAIHTPHHHGTRTTTTTSRLGTLTPGRGLTSPHGSQAVRALQRQLTQLGYRPGPIDGRYGPRTRDAITWFQTKHGLNATGTATPTTRRHLNWRTSTPPPTTTPKTTPTPTTTPDYVTTTPRPIPHAPQATADASRAAELSPAALRAILVALVGVGALVAVSSYRRTRARLAGAAGGPGRLAVAGAAPQPRKDPSRRERR